MGFLATLFGGQLLKFIPYIIALVVVVGAYFYGHHQGTIACHEKELQAVIDVQNQKMAELQKQYEDSQRVIGTLNNQNSQIRNMTRTLNEKIGKIKSPKGCEVGKDVIDLLNQARSNLGAKTGDKK